MKDTQQVRQGIQDILPTMEEALQHIVKQLEELWFEESYKLLTDFTDGVRSVEEAIVILTEGNGAEGHDLVEPLTSVFQSYESGDIEASKITVQQLLQDFLDWKEDIQKNLQQ